ncbi:ATP-dependent DNA helicase RecG [Iamia majanohamensis]|uniref:ATP-dependent DNA helicase RecG n=1 Tax=Iamia majanohamensis TaxID=467976 RepID=A0AAF0BWR6_9ACTN|nr:ATP-dependent DNA helicase RecG [Iamia majanohamensis]WCO68393.1 ATP-dependent DNA helicase RecG [Iamia majanohamensis]
MARRLSQLARLSVTELTGLGPKAAEGLEAAFGVETVLDLLTHYPRRWIDRTNEARIRDLRPGDEAMVVADVRRISSRRTRGRPPRTLVTADVSDGSGHLKVTFFNQGWRERQLPAGTQCVLFGKVDTYQGSLQMTNPVVDLLGDQTGRFVPVYPQSEKVRVTSQDVARWVAEVLDRAGTFAEPLPDWVRAEHTLTDRTRAFHGIHQPDGWDDVSVARKRLVFDELLRIQLALILRKRALERVTKGITHEVAGPDGAGPSLLTDFHQLLPFPLTGAQERVIDEITADLAGPHPMHRLLQGDVGAGKTVVALSALLVAVQGGHQGALMAPTEVLAEQHHLSIRGLLEGLTVDDGGTTLLGDRPVAVELLTARATPTERRKVLAGLADGSVDLVVGTHSLIQETVSFRSLGVVVVDEQHRFGVEQRAALRERGAGDATPDVLVMTATPIPRTAAMTVYGDLDVSVLDEMPPGRTPITTTWVRTDPPAGEADDDDAIGPLPEQDHLDGTDPEDAVWAAVRAAVGEGRQVYVVCPLIEESDKLEVRSAQETFDRLTWQPDGELASLRVALLHGRMPAAEKEGVMDRFRRGEVDVLVATTVIEVGVDVPNATVMVVLDADRFGIAQLHQLRGRVGRGAHASTCYLVGSGATEEGEARLEALVASTDGFALAEVDLDLRGEGTLMGERQKGRTDLKLASLRRDREWVAKARDVAIALVDADPELAASPLLADEVGLFLGDEEQDFLLKS